MTTQQKAIPCEFVAGLCRNCGESEQLECEGWVAPVDCVQPESKPVAWYEYNASLDSWFLSYGFNPKARTRPLYAAPVPQWIATANQMPEPCIKVLAYSGKAQAIRAQWVPAKALDATDGSSDFGEYDEATDEFYWPEGWYETNEYEEAHWLVDATVTHWMPLPDVPKGDKP